MPLDNYDSFGTVSRRRLLDAQTWTDMEAGFNQLSANTLNYPANMSRVAVEPNADGNDATVRFHSLLSSAIACCM